MRFPKLSKSDRSGSSRQQAKATNKCLRELAIRTHMGFEPLEPRMLMAGMPTLIDIVSGVGDSSPSNFTNVNNTVFFIANDPTHGEELWKSDGTADFYISL